MSLHSDGPGYCFGKREEEKVKALETKSTIQTTKQQSWSIFSLMKTMVPLYRKKNVY